MSRNRQILPEFVNQAALGREFGVSSHVIGQWLAEEMSSRYVNCQPGQFQSKLPGPYIDQGIPHWWIIQKAITELEEHRRRSGRKGRRRCIHRPRRID